MSGHWEGYGTPTMSEGSISPCIRSRSNSRGVLVRSNSPGCGELAIVPPQFELKLAMKQNDPFLYNSCQSSFGPLSVPTVCPTCHRPLAENQMDDAPPTVGERQLTPQYFRALAATVTRRPLSICDSPSLEAKFQQRLAEQGLKKYVPEDEIRGKMGVTEEEEDTWELPDEAHGATAVFSSALDENSRRGGGPETSPPRGDNTSGDWGYYKRYFREIQKLGSGTFGGVYLCQHVMEGVGLGYFALKKIPVGDNTSYLHKVLSEVRILEEVKQHPNMVEYKHSWVDTAQIADFGPPVRCLFILMEYATIGSLDSYLERHGSALPTIAVWYFFLSAVAGTAHLHRKNIIHRDLKPQNLLLTGRSEEVPRVLVSDFGTAALLSEVSYERTGGTGTVEYMAPELFECVPGTKESYIYSHTKATDVWSLGMILHYLAFDGTLPLRLSNGEVVLEVENRSHYARPPEMIQLMRLMLHRNPAKRPTCEELLESTVVRTIQRSFKKASLFTDILPTAATLPKRRRPSTVLTTPLLTPREGKDSQARQLRVNWVANNTAKGELEERKPTPCLDSEVGNEPLPLFLPKAEIPLMLQYETRESHGETTEGAQGMQKPLMVECGVQTDYVKIVYE
ncbi:protein kinase, putative [Trypanosoma brucei gambiense DAL972]|uniref:non-specific serine/threonine protein kinase n=1 Tax=Trypanosoma brucei gambiense (strain MHOM/CI/86/DAL972) TaxID=679716 RepID=C9ZK32_TRYB9|nr:protein kinase, putative [Trypanosoma brucei gambiense DAL972]CBH09796.1 protein kinase, putative [Trypanosoma brucei gambiense DAL972]|eukprot:XP_011772089.1 protein kinase, putative [Trypanosoma brucei gambiense DAL972]